MVDMWPPTTKEALEQALAEGLLDEGHFVDLKSALPPAGKNTDIAVDLASFSIDGGLIFIGVQERPRVRLVPIDLAGVAERVEQVGLASPDPPVRVRSMPIVLDSTTGRGVLVVVVPPSPLAPHMVDGRYRGRSDRTNIVLSDGEVSRIRRELRARETELGEAMRAYAAAPQSISPDGPILLAIARPSVADRELLLRCWQSDGASWVKAVLIDGPLTQVMNHRWSPGFNTGILEPRANGWAVTTSTRNFQTGEVSTPLDLEILEDGTMRMRCSELNYPTIGDRTVNDIAINGLVRRLVLAARAASERCSYFGSWGFAVYLAPLRGRIAESARQGRTMPPYSEDWYGETIVATVEDLAADVDGVADRLLGRLNRSFGGPSVIIPR